MQKRKNFGKKEYTISLCRDFNGIMFGDSRELVRRKINMKYKEYKKNEYSVNSLDDYDAFQVYYDKNDNLECVEIVSGKVYIDDNLVFPGTIKNAERLIQNLKFDGYGYCSIEDSVGITPAMEDENMIEGILFGCKGYYKEQ